MTRSPTLRPHKPSVRELIERPHHTAVSCRDWDQMRAFFVDLLGFKVVGEMDTRNEPELSTVTGLPGATCRWAMLALGGYHIELFKWLTPEGKSVPIRPGAAAAQRQHLGQRRVAGRSIARGP